MTQHVFIRNTAQLGAAFRAKRKALGLTQQQFAELSLVGVRFLSEFERGKETAEVGLILKVLGDAGLEVIVRDRTFEGMGDL